MKNVQWLLLLVIAILLSSCDGNKRDLKKFESRLNAKEYDCASVYIYDGDLPVFSFFVSEIEKKNPNLLIKLKNSSIIEISGNKAIVADFELVNSSNQVRNYFTNIGYKLSEDYTFRDTIFIRHTSDGEKLSFNWGLKSSDENQYCLASISGDRVSSLNIRSNPTTGSKVIGSLDKGNEILVENKDENEKWEHCYMVNNDGQIIDGYIYNENLSYQTSSFFSLGLFDSMTLTVAIIVLVVICVIFVFGSSLFAMIAAIPVGGIIIIVGCILGFLYAVYQLLEKILFELFIINLPY